MLFETPFIQDSIAEGLKLEVFCCEFGDDPFFDMAADEEVDDVKVGEDAT